ncbi:restriction endonuclease subunit S [Priestia megaterium]|uniref:restriction endonuclease subunit S n=1 Tax=Priestia megaterium TaxID=1404 RepID=UPI0034D492CC
MKNKYTPDIRFSGVTGIWEEHKLKDIAILNPKSVLPEQFEYVDLESVVGTDLISYRTEYRESAPSRAQRLAKKGDIFYQTVRPYQKNNYLFNLPYDNYVFSTGYAQMRPNVDSYFLFSKLQDEKFVSKVLDRCTGTSYPAINSNDLAQIEVRIPMLRKEQSEIGKLFRQIDKTISLYQQELITLNQTRQGFLQKMFPKEGEFVPEIRFPGFTGDWEQRTLEGILEVNSGKDYKHLQKGDIPVYGTGGYMLSVNDKLSDEDAIGIGRKGTIDNPQLLKAPFWTVDTLFYMTTKEKNDLLFCYSLAKKIQWKKYDESTGVPSLSKSSINKISVSIPTPEEQLKIGNFFKQLDETIAFHQRELDSLKETKKAFLQKMFV